MQIVEFNQVGNPVDVLNLKTVDDRAPEAGEVKLKVLASPIHPANLLQIAGQYAADPVLPAVPGMEGIGEVVEVGPGVSHLKAGQNVLLTGVSGTWRDSITASAATLIPAPPGDVEQLSMLAVNPMTAFLLLRNFVDLKEGDWIIQSAANSAVGEMVVQLAAKRGIKTVNVVRRDSLLQNLKSLGGTVALVDGPDLAERVSAATGGAQIKLALDCVAGETFERLVETLGYGSTIVSYGSLTNQSPRLNLRTMVANNMQAHAFWLQKWYELESQETKQAAFAELIPLVASGQIKTKIDSRYPLSEIKEAVTRASEDGRDGKVLLTPIHH